MEKWTVIYSWFLMSCWLIISKLHSRAMCKGMSSCLQATIPCSVFPLEHQSGRLRCTLTCPTAQKTWNGSFSKVFNFFYFTSQTSFTRINCNLGILSWNGKGSFNNPRSSRYLERKAPAFVATFKLLEFSKNDSNMVCTSPKKQQIYQVSRVWLKNYVLHALLKFEIVLAGNTFWVKVGTSNLVESWKLMSTPNGKSLVLISQTTFE